MMSSEAGYAVALFRAACLRGCTQQVVDELPAVETFLDKNARVFYNPEIKAAVKAGILRELLEGKADDLTAEFVLLLNSRRRLKALRGIRRRFERMAAIELGRVVVRLRFPFEPSEELLERVKAYLLESGMYSQAHGERVEFEITLDKSLIGGFTAESGGRMLDKSLKTRLGRMRRA